MDTLKIHTTGKPASKLEACILNARRALVLAPHPDDEALGCAGTLLQLNRRGVTSTTVCVTDGERLHGDPSVRLGRARQDEARHVAKRMGSGDPLFLCLPDGAVGAHSSALAGELQRTIAAQTPDLVFAPSPVDYHEDHIATALAAMKVFRALPTFTLAFYEVYGLLRFNCLVDITAVAEEKRNLILSYRISLCERPEIYARAALGLNAHRSIFLQTEGSYEAFWVLSEPLTDQELVGWLTFGASPG